MVEETPPTQLQSIPVGSHAQDLNFNGAILVGALTLSILHQQLCARPKMQTASACYVPGISARKTLKKAGICDDSSAYFGKRWVWPTGAVLVAVTVAEVVSNFFFDYPLTWAVSTSPRVGECWVLGAACWTCIAT